MRWLEKFNLWRLREELFSRNEDSEVTKISHIFVQSSENDVTDADDVIGEEENNPGFAKYCQSTT